MYFLFTSQQILGEGEAGKQHFGTQILVELFSIATFRPLLNYLWQEL